MGSLYDTVSTTTATTADSLSLTTPTPTPSPPSLVFYQQPPPQLIYLNHNTPPTGHFYEEFPHPAPPPTLTCSMARVHDRQSQSQQQPPWPRNAREPSEPSVSASTSSGSSPRTAPQLPIMTQQLPPNKQPVAPAPPAPAANQANQTATSSSSSTPQPKNTKRGPDGKVTRKKVAKACLACQKSHLTCDESRPCTRCVKKGIGDQCVEGVRKKAKYLMEGDERAPPPPPQPQPQASIPPPPPGGFSGSPNNHPFGNVNINMLPGVLPLQQVQPERIPDNIWLTTPMVDAQPPPQPLQDWNLQQNNEPFNFTSTAAANLEYEMFDSMFAGLSPSFPLGDIAAPPGNTGSTTDGSTPTIWSNLGFTDPNGPPSDGTVMQNQDSNMSMPMMNQNQGQGQNQQQQQPMEYTNSNGWQPEPQQQQQQQQEQPQPQQPQQQQQNHDGVPKKMTPEELYSTVVKPYDYTEGYHNLISYLESNFEKPDFIRVVKALAAFRPSLIALQVGMTEEDDVFVERSFQRTLIELDKLISYSATPTAVWRRTGEIVCVAPQFCQLVGQTEEQLVGQRTPIWRLLSKASTTAYWENFAEHAFENSTQNFFQATTLETPKGSIPCAASFTIRRDTFDLPSVIIGQFLPIPPEAM